MLSQWSERSHEVAHLFNPAFSASVIYDAVRGYVSMQGTGMPIALTFLVIPISATESVRNDLPRSIRTKMHVWLQERPERTMDFALQTRSLLGVTREAIMFGVNAFVLEINDGGNLVLGAQSLRLPRSGTSEEIVAIRQKAYFIGRWFADAGPIEAIFSMWGIAL